jgi:BON domain
MRRIIAIGLCSVLVLAFAAGSTLAEQRQTKPELKGPSKRDLDRTMRLAEQVRHQLVTLPYYGVFDWLEGRVLPNGTVVLRGEVIRPLTKSDAEKRVKSLESVTKVINEIELLPVSLNDDQIRREIYNAIFRFDSPLFRYKLPPNPPIHIIVKRGRATLKGIVLNTMDRQLAEVAARQAPDVFQVTNQLMVEKPSRQSR